MPVMWNSNKLKNHLLKIQTEQTYEQNEIPRKYNLAHNFAIMTFFKPLKTTWTELEPNPKFRKTNLWTWTYKLSFNILKIIKLKNILVCAQDTYLCTCTVGQNFKKVYAKKTREMKKSISWNLFVWILFFIFWGYKYNFDR